jgi:hypothetical protein
MKLFTFNSLRNAAFILLCLAISSCKENNDHGGNAGHHKTVRNNFPDFGRMVSPQYFLDSFPGEEVFKLRQDYPKTMPDKSELPSFLEIPFDDDNWMKYINAVRDYCFDGMIDVDFKAQKCKTRDWYHMPWMHWGSQGSEGFHGLAKEAQINPYQLTATQTNPHQTYALGYYNKFAGYTLGKMWANPLEPDAYATQNPEGFPVGTVIFKLLFTDADETEVDYLVNPFTWKAYITPSWLDGGDTGRVVTNMHLIQMDFMVRDPRADKYGTGWVFGTFCYNGKLNGDKTGAQRAKNLVPVGIQFGNDPEDTANWINTYPITQTMINTNLKQTKINPSKDLPAQHLGWSGRLDGPVDLNTASCMSCHATGEFPQIASLVPKQCFIGNYNAAGQLTELTETDAPAFRKYFTNLRCGTPYDSTATSTDFSLQVSLALGYFWEWKNGVIGGYWYDDYERVKSPAHRSGKHK